MSVTVPLRSPLSIYNEITSRNDEPPDVASLSSQTYCHLLRTRSQPALRDRFLKEKVKEKEKIVSDDTRTIEIPLVHIAFELNILRSVVCRQQ